MPQDAPRRDPLYPNGGRPPCTNCRKNPVYLGGLCGDCYAAEGAANRARKGN